MLNNILATAEQILHSPVAFFFPLCLLAVSRLGVGKDLGEDIAEVADPN